VNVLVLIYSFIDLDLFHLTTLGVVQAMQCLLIGFILCVTQRSLHLITPSLETNKLLCSVLGY
jgi:hypothetical protein